MENLENANDNNRNKRGSIVEGGGQNVKTHKGIQWNTK